MAEVKSYKVLSLPSNPTPDSIYWVKGSSASDVEGFITDRQGVPYPLKDISGSGGITDITNTDGNLVIIGASNKEINIATALLSIINSALQSGDSISELVNDAGYITSASLPTKTSELINDGENGNPFVDTNDLGAVAFSNDYTDLDNIPTTFTPSAHTHVEADITDLDKYTQLEVDNFLADKFDTPTGNNTEYLDGAGVPTTFPTIPDVSGFVPYTGATTNVDLGEYQIKVGQLEFDQTPTGIFGVGMVRWNDTDGTTERRLKGNNVTLQDGQEVLKRVVNKTGSNLLESEYKVVRIRTVAEGGAQGQRSAVVLAQANTNSKGIIGVVTENITNNQEGFITLIGEVREINTTGSLQSETWVDGDLLYLSPTTAGQLTNVVPVSPNYSIPIATIDYAHAVHGKISVHVGERLALDTTLSGNNDTAPSETAVKTYVDSGLNAKLSNDISTYTPATTPLAGTELALIDDGTGFKKVAVSDLSITQKNYYELAKSQVKRYTSTYDGSIFYRKLNNLVSALIPITFNKYMFVDFLKDSNDDFIKLGEVGYCDVVEEEIFQEKLNGTLSGTFNTVNPNSYTTQVGATITTTFTGSSIYFNHYADNRGGIWLFTLNTGETFTLSTYNATALSKITKLFDLDYGTYTIVATFQGADPLNPPSGGTARGWFVYTASEVDKRTFSIYDFGFNTSNKKLILNGSSNKEFAITVKRVGTAFAEQWIPQHSGVGTVFGSSLFLIDNEDFTALPNRPVFLACDSVELQQDMQGKNSLDSVFLANILTSHLIDKDGVKFNGTIEWIEQTFSSDGYVNMLPINIATFGTKMLDSFGNSYDLTKTDGSSTIFPKKDDLISLCVIDDNDDFFLGIDYNGSNETFLKNIGNYPTFANGMISRFWIQHRDASINKFYAQTYFNQTINDNETHHFNFSLLVANLKNAYRQLQKNNIYN